ncbi:ribosome small subunit-dependent GTPase A [Geomonas propionica]|uniref:Small ribosomal subunit biogenesis GTPase RsgA n=1 Tax=Geomonas propionica TaxID=2798582 RepID=A0ABS0YXL3_9BACT|nr:ribosome small subunit-dependent GTPase A [Geomonas propionica]MBJ6802690.1 ribosome small subunit-dependent GTPase A [Geomonas propionica]
MSNRQSELEKLGWNERLAGLAALQKQSIETVARVAAVDRDQLLLLDDKGTFRAKLSGSYLHHHRRPEELPCVGDWVCVERGVNDDFGLIHTMLERRTSLCRKAVGGVNESQMIAANMDFVIIVQSCHFDFNLKRLERYLVMVMEGGATPYVLLTKTDLVEPDVLTAQLSQIRAAGITAPVLPLSNVSREGIEELKRNLLPGMTYCFVGSSGVGKSTIINELIGRGRLETQDVSATGEGKHTTVRRELIRLANGALVIDNPGMREFGIVAAENGIGGSFIDINALASGCRYRDCSHTSEPGCAVLEALSAGAIDQEHFQNYAKLTEEAKFYQMSHAEKRKKDRDFGKFIKSVKKDMKRD